MPAHCTALGKCLLAQLPGDVARARLGEQPYSRRTDRTLTTWRKLAADLAAIRKTGIAISEEEYEVGLVSIAVPVRWIGGSDTAAVNVSLPAGRATEDFRRQLTEALLAAADAIERDLGAA